MTKNGSTTRRKNEIIPCCSPTQLSPIQLLYVDSNNTITQKTLPNMVVEACGCMWFTKVAEILPQIPRKYPTSARSIRIRGPIAPDSIVSKATRVWFPSLPETSSFWINSHMQPLRILNFKGAKLYTKVYRTLECSSFRWEFIETLSRRNAMLLSNRMNFTRSFMVRSEETRKTFKV